MRLPLLIPLLLGIAITAFAVERTPVPNPPNKISPPDAEWTGKIRSLAPAKPRVAPKSPRKVLVFSLATGYCHAVIPHVRTVMDTLAATGAFEVTHSDDVEVFASDSLAQFDAVVLNNTCSKGPGRNIFLDALAARKDLSDEARAARAAELETALTSFVAGGKGLVGVHGGITFLNHSDDFNKLIGGAFQKHPKIQEITVEPVDPSHPLVAAFRGEAFIHHDEPYLFHRGYADFNFRPLLEMDVAKLKPRDQKTMAGERRFVSWIKPHGKGRVFYVSPSHQPESYESGRMLQFYLDGLQYALGDLPCDDSPVGK